MTAAISIDKLCVCYGKMQALHNATLNIPSGSFFGLLGANGAGKSTLLNVINTILTPTSGSISIEGISVTQSPKEAKRRVGVVPQEINLNNFEFVRNVLYNQAGYFGRRRAEVSDRLEYLLRKLNLWEKRDAQVMHLSGGMKRRLMIARALISSPSVLLLDEPTAGVDVEIRRQIWNFIQHINRHGTTVVLTTHYLEEAEYLCDRIALLRNGEIIKHDTKKNILAALNTQSFILETKNILPNKMQLNCTSNISRQSDFSCLISIDGGTSINQMMKELDAANIEVATIRQHKSRLEALITHNYNPSDKDDY